MPSLQVRDLPETLYKKLLTEAEKDHRSLGQQAVVILAKGLGVSENSKERRKNILRSFRDEPVHTLNKPLKNPATLIREDRDR